ncbi:MAG: hypothetical protein ABSH52_22240 [Terriglobia bacterium]|jgi:hypothetical protein
MAKTRAIQVTAAGPRTCAARKYFRSGILNLEFWMRPTGRTAALRGFHAGQTNACP